MDMAERYGSLFRRWLRSADRLSDRAIARGESFVNTRRSRSKASLRSVTRCDQRFLRLRVGIAPRDELERLCGRLWTARHTGAGFFGIAMVGRSATMLRRLVGG